ncbi:MAG: DUF6301 family protein [Propionibacteriaceae bacterium]|jgi:hypothetical protein|nr:DUF6301 family protein [Propionibacteriaceae bacterium]
MGNENQNTGSIRHLTVKELKPILDVFAQVTWPVPEAEIPALIEKLDWTFIADDVHIKADTHLPVDYTIGDFAKPHGELIRLMFHLADTVDDMADTAGLAAVQAAYPLLVGEIQSVWGEPTGSQEPQPEDTAKTWWDMPAGGRLSVHNSPGRITAHLMNPRFAAVERYYQSHPREDYPELYEYEGDDSED